MNSMSVRLISLSKDERPIVVNEGGEFVCEGFFKRESNDRLRKMIEQSNQFAELKGRMLAIADSRPDVKKEMSDLAQSCPELKAVLEMFFYQSIEESPNESDFEPACRMG